MKKIFLCFESGSVTDEFDSQNPKESKPAAQLFDHCSLFHLAG